MLFAVIAQWLGIQHSFLNDIFYGTDAQQVMTQTVILIAGILIFATLSIIAYRVAIKRFLRVEI